MFQLKSTCTPFFLVKRHYWMYLMLEKESLNFLIRLHSHLWLLQGCFYTSLKKRWYLNLKLTELQTEKVFERFCGWDFNYRIFWEQIWQIVYWSIQCWNSLLKKLKSILLKDFYLNFAKKDKCIFTLFPLKVLLFLLVIIITGITTQLHISNNINWNNDILNVGNKINEYFNSVYFNKWITY